MVSVMADGATDRCDDWTAAVTFVPADPPRTSSLACWRPDAATGLFADDPGAGAMLDVVVPRGERPRRESVAVRQVALADAIMPLLELDGAATGLPPASVSARWWSAATVVALDQIGRAHV